jgi:L-threonylcarbamoyladenylate synthase
MEIISGHTQGSIEKASEALKNGSLVAFPTETVYGIGADATNKDAVGRIYSVKGRPEDHPLIVHISSVSMIEKWARDIPDYAKKLAEEFWPGPMTLILKRSNLAKNFITGKQHNVGLRIPNQSVALKLLTQFEKIGGLGIAAPSANRFGAVSPTTTEAVMDELGNFLQYEDLIIDGGQCSIGLESTIIDCTKTSPTILRPGAISLGMVEDLTGFKTNISGKKIGIRTSGSLGSHYSPNAEIFLNRLAAPGEGFIALANIPTPKGAIRLASPVDIVEYAKSLYIALRCGDKKGLKQIAIVPPDGNGLALAIRDRISKAAG